MYIIKSTGVYLKYFFYMMLNEMRKGDIIPWLVQCGTPVPVVKLKRTFKTLVTASQKER
jgi:hypothetical protein